MNLPQRIALPSSPKKSFRPLRHEPPPTAVQGEEIQEARTWEESCREIFRGKTEGPDTFDFSRGTT
jgi:hypothetical protein